MTKLTQAILAVMQEVKNVEKNLSVGTGYSSYKGVADKDVKQVVGTAMGKHGLVILPIAVEPKTTVSEWEEGEKHKTSVFTEVRTKYMLIHESGESIEICGYGHGVDSQDKSAGKATTYALKNALLYTFLVPTGDIDDTDNTHSDDLPQRTRTKQEETGLTATCPIHNVVMKRYENAKGEWWSHKLDGGGFCNGKQPKAAPQKPKQEEEYDYSQVTEDIPF